MTKTVIITGASSGIGAACAKCFADNGYQLILLARRLERLQELAATLPEVNTHIARFDITRAADVERVLTELPVAFQAPDVLINNAGLALGLEPAHAVDINDWQTMVDTNITGLLRVTRQLLPGMVERNRGHIINIASTAGSWPYPGGNTYCASKAFVQQFTRGLKADLLGTNLRVTEISPGMTETEFSEVRFKQDAEKAKNVYKNTQPLTAKDIAEIIFWVTSVPAHVNINSLEVMPVNQAWGPLVINRPGAS